MKGPYAKMTRVGLIMAMLVAGAVTVAWFLESSGEDLPAFQESDDEFLASFPTEETLDKLKRQGFPRYFPPQVFLVSGRNSDTQHEPGLNSTLYDAHFSAHLAAFKEPSLYEARTSSGFHGYRFTWLRTFHKPVCIRLEHRADSTRVVIAKRTNGAGGYSPGVIELSRESLLSQAEFNHIELIVEKTGFWCLPSSIDDDGFDGSRWMLEGVKNNNYHMVQRWSPQATNELRKVCVRMLEIGGVKGRPVY